MSRQGSRVKRARESGDRDATKRRLGQDVLAKRNADFAALVSLAESKAYQRKHDAQISGYLSRLLAEGSAGEVMLRYRLSAERLSHIVRLLAALMDAGMPALTCSDCLTIVALHPESDRCGIDITELQCLLRIADASAKAQPKAQFYTECIADFSADLAECYRVRLLNAQALKLYDQSLKHYRKLMNNYADNPAILVQFEESSVVVIECMLATQRSLFEVGEERGLSAEQLLSLYQEYSRLVADPRRFGSDKIKQYELDWLTQTQWMMDIAILHGGYLAQAKLAAKIEPYQVLLQELRTKYFLASPTLPSMYPVHCQALAGGAVAEAKADDGCFYLALPTGPMAKAPSLSLTIGKTDQLNGDSCLRLAWMASGVSSSLHGRGFGYHCIRHDGGARRKAYCVQCKGIKCSWSILMCTVVMAARL